MARIATVLLDWYELHGRDLPWRATRDPYRIWLSEVILQQTRVAQGLAYYERFTARYPDVEALASASEDDVLKLWQGLGYYSRARNLLAAARQVVSRFGGRFPVRLEEVRSLCGVGDYTAAAVCSAAYDTPCAVVDGNVYRVLSRLFDVEEPVDSAAGRRSFASLAQSLLDTRSPGRYNQAVMDFGALQCTPVSPACDVCPLSDTCMALAAGTVGLRPVKRGRVRIRERWFNYLHITCNGYLLLQRRGEGDIWQGLYEFPLIETDRAFAFDELAATDAFRSRLGSGPWHLTGYVVLPRHQLSHQRLHTTVYRIEVRELDPKGGALVVPEAAAGDYPISRLLERYLIR